MILNFKFHKLRYLIPVHVLSFRQLKIRLPSFTLQSVFQDISKSFIRGLFFGEVLLSGFYDKKKTGANKNLSKLKNAILSEHRNQLW